MVDSVGYVLRPSMFPLTLRTSPQPALCIPSMSAQTGTQAAKRAIPSPCKCPGDQEPETSSIPVILPQRTPGAYSSDHSPFSDLCLENLSSATRNTISLNSAKGFSSFVCSRLRRAFSTQSQFTSMVFSSARLNLNDSLNSLFARFRS